MPTKRSEFVDFLLDQLRGVGPVHARAMFGGWGIYHAESEVMFGLVADDVFYFKVDDGNRQMFEELGLQPFEYEKKDGKTTVMSFFECPDTAMENHEVMAQWAGEAIAAAQRQKKPKRPRKKSGKKSRKKRKE